MHAVAKAILRGLILSGILMLVSIVLWQISPVLGSVVMLVGSFAMMLASYSRQWRLNWLTCLLPPVSAGASYGIQLAVLGLEPEPILVIPAAGVGLLLGLVRGLGHRLEVRGRAILARKSWLFLLVWMVSYLLTQLCTLARSRGMVTVGLVGGVFSVAALAMTAFVLLFRYIGKLPQTQMAAASSGRAGGGPPPPPAMMLLALVCGWALLGATAPAWAETDQQVQAILKKLITRAEIEDEATVTEEGWHRGPGGGLLRTYNLNEFGFEGVAVGLTAFDSVDKARQLFNSEHSDFQQAEAQWGGEGVKPRLERIDYGESAFLFQGNDGSQAAMVQQDRFLLVVNVSMNTSWIAEQWRLGDLHLEQKSRQWCLLLLEKVYPRFCAELGLQRQGSGIGPSAGQVGEALDRLGELLGGRDRASAEVRRIAGAGAAASVLALLASLLTNIMAATGATAAQATSMLAQHIQSTMPPPTTPGRGPPAGPGGSTPPPPPGGTPGPPAQPPPVPGDSSSPPPASRGTPPPPPGSGRSTPPPPPGSATRGTPPPVPTGEQPPPAPGEAQPTEPTGPLALTPEQVAQRNKRVLDGYLKLIDRQEYSGEVLRQFEQAHDLAERGDWDTLAQRYRDMLRQQVGAGQDEAAAEAAWARLMGWGETGAKLTVAASKAAIIVVGGQIAGSVAAGGKVVGVLASALASGAVSGAGEGAEAQARGESAGQIVKKTGGGFLSGAKDGAIGTFTNLPGTSVATKVFLPAAADVAETYIRTGDGQKALASGVIEAASGALGAKLDGAADSLKKEAAEVLLGGVTAGTKNVYVNDRDFGEGFTEGAMGSLAGKLGGAAAKRGGTHAADYTPPPDAGAADTEPRPPDAEEGDATPRPDAEEAPATQQVDEDGSASPDEQNAGKMPAELAGETPASRTDEPAQRDPAAVEGAPESRPPGLDESDESAARLRDVLKQVKDAQKETIPMDGQAPITQEMAATLHTDYAKDGNGYLVRDDDGNVISRTYVDADRALQQLQDPAASRTAKQAPAEIRDAIINTRDDILYAPADTQTIRATEQRLQQAFDAGETDIQLGPNKRLRMDTFSTPGEEGKSLGADRDARLVVDTIDPATGKVVATREVPREFWEDQAYRDFYEHTSRLSRAAGREVSEQTVPGLADRVRELQHLRGEGLTDEQILHRAYAAQHNQLFTDRHHIEASADNADQRIGFERTDDGIVRTQEQGTSSVVDAKDGRGRLQDPEGYGRMWVEKSEFYAHSVPSEAIAQSQKGIAQYLKLRDGYLAQRMEPPPIQSDVAGAMEILLRAPVGVDATPQRLAEVREQLKGLGFRDLPDAMRKIAQQSELLKWSRNVPAEGAAPQGEFGQLGAGTQAHLADDQLPET